MIRERIADDIYVFTSKRYAQVTASAIMTKDGVVLIDTLFFPDETRAMRYFLEERLGHRIRYLILSHYHADHTMGTYLFPHAQVISHALCRELIDTAGREGLSRTREQLSDFQDVKLVLPDTIFSDGKLSVHIGGKTLRLQHNPGHSPDLISVMVMEERILFASDNMMPVPTIFDGSYDDLVNSLNAIRAMEPDTIVQGHGEVILRGEVQNVIEDDLRYLEEIHEKVSAIVADGRPEGALDAIDIEDCGKSRIPLNGFVTELHRANLNRLYLDLTETSANGQR